MRKKPKYTRYLFSLLIIYGISYMFRHYIAILTERSWCLRDGRTVSSNVVHNNAPIHIIPSTVHQLSISQKALGTLPEDGNVMAKHVGATVHN
jgi:hypothetical protein